MNSIRDLEWQVAVNFFYLVAHLCTEQLLWDALGPSPSPAEVEGGRHVYLLDNYIDSRIRRFLGTVVNPLLYV